MVLLLAGCGGGAGTSATVSPVTTPSGPSGFDFGANDPFRVTAFGDSITLGVVDQDILARTPYPTRLQSLLRGLDGRYRVTNRGVGGEDTSEGLRRFSAILARDRPGYVLIMEGTNDATLGERPGVIAGNLRQMVDRAQANHTIPVLATIPPNFRTNPRPPRIIDGANEMIRALAQEEGIVLVDIFAGMNDRSLFFGPDPLHPTQRGYNTMADLWFVAMREAIQPALTHVAASSNRQHR